MDYTGLYLILITILLIIIYILLYINTAKTTYKGGNIITDSFDSLNTLYTNTKQDIQNSELLNKATTLYDNTKQDIQNGELLNKATTFYDNTKQDIQNSEMLNKATTIYDNTKQDIQNSEMLNKATTFYDNTKQDIQDNLITDNLITDNLTTGDNKLNEIMDDINELSQNVKLNNNMSSYTLAPKQNIDYIKTGSIESIEMLDKPIQKTTLKPYIQTKTKTINKEEQDRLINEKLNRIDNLDNINGVNGVNGNIDTNKLGLDKTQKLYEYEILKPVKENNYDEYGYKLMTGWELPIHKKPLCIKNPDMKCPPCDRKNNITTHYLRVDRDSKKIENDFSNITKYNSDYKPLSDELMTDRYLKNWNRPLGSMDDIPECLECPPCYDDFDNRVSVW